MQLREDEVELPNGKTIRYLVQPYDGSGGVVIICRDNEKILLQKEYSYPVDEVLWQFPGGKIETNESPAAAANRELAEESGLRARQVAEIGAFYADNRRTSARLHVVVAENFSKHNLTPDTSEIIESEWIEINDIKQMIKKGEIKNYAFLAAWALFSSL